MASTFKAMEQITDILDSFEKSERKQILRAVAEKYGLAGDGDASAALAAERARSRRMIRGTSSLGTAVDIDPVEIDELHDRANSAGIEDTGVSRGGGVFG
jgi:hypothetical protein